MHKHGPYFINGMVLSCLLTFEEQEHVHETSKKRRLDSMQKASAVRSFVKNVSAQESQDIDKYMNTVDTLSRWQDQNNNENEDVKTVSRLVQSYERVAVRTLLAAVQQGWASGYGTARMHVARMLEVS